MSNKIFCHSELGQNLADKGVNSLRRCPSPAAFALAMICFSTTGAQGQMSQSLPLCLWKKPEIEAALDSSSKRCIVAKLTIERMRPAWFSVSFLVTPDITFGGETCGVSPSTGESYLRLIRRLRWHYRTSRSQVAY